MAYRYIPLSDQRAEIRVAELQPGAYDDEIRISFRVRQIEVGTLELQSKSFPYEALSYAWGTRDDLSQVRVADSETDHGIISVTQNLDIALRHLRLKERSRPIWVDALCIDQSNDDEKGQQVAMMGIVFSSAHNVVAWLGPEADNSNGALEVLRQIAHHVKMKEPEWTDRNVSIPFHAGELEHVCALLERPYFERLWIRQEVILATSAFVKCGQRQMLFKDFQLAIRCLYEKSYNSSAIPKVQWINFNKAKRIAKHACCTKAGEYDYPELRNMLREAKCQDHRDRIYAVLRLLDYEDQELAIEPDYTRTVEELYADVARRVLVNRHHLRLLETCELSSRVLDIPSWVPDWSNRMNSPKIPYSNWSACGWISAQSTTTCMDKISVAGVAAARVERIIEIKISEDTWENESEFQILRDLQSSVQALGIQRGSFSSSVESHCRALVANQFSDTYWPADHSTPDFEDSKKALEKFWSSDLNLKWHVDLSNQKNQTNLKYWRYCRYHLIGRCFISATGGYVGLAPVGTQPNDVICVLLGSSLPVVLRPVLETPSGKSWQVVGVCNVDGLMNGEAIYGGKLSSHYLPVWRKDPDYDMIDRSWLALYDSRTRNLNTDPAKILTEMGIKVESYQRDPHLLEVLPETLRAAGVALQDFTLV